MKAALNSDPTTSHPPLARDQYGNLLELPDGTSAWRVSRHTGGRPRAVVSPDGQPLRLPLDTTIDALAEMCGADTYRVYAIDEFGNLLGHVSTVEAGVEKPSESELPMFRNAGPPTPGTDLRFALEAITHMARTNSEAMRAIAESQADWVKAIAAAKGLPRNVAFPPPPPPPDEDDDEEEADEPGPAKKGGVDAFLEAVSPYVPGMMSAWQVKGAKKTGSAETKNSVAHFARIRLALVGKERDYLDILLADEQAGDAIASELAQKSVDEAAAWIRATMNRQPVKTPVAKAPTNLMNDPLVVKKVQAISLLLAPDERARLMKLAPRMMNSPDALEIIEKLVPLSDKDAAEWLRSHLAEIESRFAS